MKNLIDFLNNKQYLIIKKINKIKTDIINLKQLGETTNITQLGGSMSDQIKKLEEEIVKLVGYYIILSNQKKKTNNINFDEMIKYLTDATTKYSKLIDVVKNDDLKKSLYSNQIINLMKDIDAQINGTDFLNIELKKSNNFITPPLDINLIEYIYKPVIEKTNEDIKKYINDIDKSNTDTNNNENLKNSIEELNKQIEILNNYDKTIKENTNKITQYYDVFNNDDNYEINISNYIEPKDILEMITVKKLTNINKDTKLEDIESLNRALSSIPNPEDDNYLKIINNNPEYLTNPDYKAIAQISGGGFITKNKNIINSLVKKWDNELIKNKNKLYNKNIKNKKDISSTFILKGGSFDDYSKNLMEFQNKQLEYKQIYNKLINDANIFNLEYSQFYHHKLFIINYVKFVFLNEDYRIYQNISRGTISYYKSIVKDILSKIDKLKASSDLYGYFYIYHYITLKILNIFLTKIHMKWKGYSIENDEEQKNKSRLLILNNTDYNPEIKKGLFLLNLFKDILDDYKLKHTSHVSVYLRINDYGTIPLEIFKKRVNDETKLDIDSLNKCIGCTDEQCKTIIEPFNDKIIFNEIYDPEGFKNNDVLALYMGLPNYLSKNQSIMMMTYGYSGVGKTYTLFGGENNQGILQKTLSSIQGSTAIYTRSYEIYGLALPYKAYWSNIKPEDYKHNIYAYKFNNNSIEKPIKIENKEIQTYLDDIKYTDTAKIEKSYEKIEQNNITDFYKFVDSIDKFRTKEGRIKKTINNNESSRSIMVYEFKVKLTNNIVNFVIMDLPGKEDILNSYVKPTKPPIPPKEYDFYSDYCIKLKKEIISYNYNENAIRAAIYLNPILLATFPEIAKKLNNFMNTNINSDYKDFIITTYNKDRKMLNENINMEILINWVNSDVPLIQFINKDKFIEGIYTDNDKNNFKECVLASENLRYLLENNMIDTLIKFYNEKLIDNNNNCDNYSSISFEGFYINENILGLINTLSMRLTRDNEEKQLPKQLPIKAMNNYFSENLFNLNNTERPIEIVTTINKKIMDKYNINVNKITGKGTLYKIKYTIEDNNGKLIAEVDDPSNETRSQTYFIRDFLRKYLKDDTMNFDYNTEYKDRTIQKWFEDSYDFNMTYADEPPIATFMKAYFGKDDTGNKDVIDNFNLFFVASNTKGLDSCEKQIKLIADSKIFIDTIREWVPPQI